MDATTRIAELEMEVQALREQLAMAEAERDGAVLAAKADIWRALRPHVPATSVAPAGATPERVGFYKTLSHIASALRKCGVIRD